MTLEKKEAKAEKEEAEKYQKIQQELASYESIYIHVHIHVQSCTVYACATIHVDLAA